MVSTSPWQKALSVVMQLSTTIHTRIIKRKITNASKYAATHSKITYTPLPLPDMVSVNYCIRITAVLLLFFAAGNPVSAQSKTFSPEALRQDLLYLKDKLFKYHVSLFTYSTPAQIEQAFSAIEQQLRRSLTEEEFYKAVTPISAVIKDGHTLLLPSLSSRTYNAAHGSYLPYHLTLENNRLFVDHVGSSDSAIKPGDEIKSINGIVVDTLLTEMLLRQGRDGNNQTYPIWILNNYFRPYYSYIYGRPSTFEITYLHQEKPGKATVKALPLDSITYYTTQSRITPNNNKQALSLGYSADSACAILAIKDFHKEVLLHTYHQSFKKTITNFFKSLQQSKAQTLILDLRDNQGGDLEYGAHLLRYLLDTTFTVVQGYKVLAEGEQRLKEVKGPCTGLMRPYKQVFKGTLIVLINGGSFSNSGIVSACLRRYGRAYFIGEETGGNNTTLAGYIKTIRLPNTRMEVQIPTRQFILNNGNPQQSHGTVPDVQIGGSLKKRLQGTDDALEKALQLGQQ